MQLSAGNQTTDYTMYICIGVADAVGSKSYVFTPALQVYPAQSTAVLQTAADHSTMQQLAINSPAQFQALANAIINTIYPPSYATSTTATSVNSTVVPATQQQQIRLTQAVRSAEV